MNEFQRGLSIVLKREYLERVRTKAFVVITLLGPLMFFAMMFVPLLIALKTKISPKVADITIIDATGTRLGSSLAEAIRSAATAERAPRVVSMQSWAVADAASASLDDVRAAKQRGFLVIDSATLATGRASYVGRNAASIADIGLIQQQLRREIIKERLRRAGVTDAEAATVASLRANVDAIRVDESGRTTRSGGSGMWLGIALGFALYGLIAFYGMAVLRSVTEEKESRAAEMVLSSVSPDALVGGKVLGVGLVALTQVSVWALSGLLLARVRGPLLARFGVEVAVGTPALPPMPAALVVVILLSMILGFLLYASLFAMVASTVSTQADAQQAMVPALLPLVLSIMIVQPTAMHPDAMVSRLASWFPLTAPIILPVRMLVGSPSGIEVVATLLGTAATMVLALWISARVYRTTMLMYGKRPTLPQLLQMARRSA